MILMERATPYVTMELNKGHAKARAGANPETVSQFGSFSATREREVGISSNGGSARHRELYLGLVHIIHHNLGTGNV